MLDFNFRQNAETASFGPFLIKACRHDLSTCNVCKNQIPLEKNRSRNQIIQRKSFPEVEHTGFNCTNCTEMSPIRGNAYFCLSCDDFVVCETCCLSNQNMHQHPLILAASKLSKRRIHFLSKFPMYVSIENKHKIHIT